MAKPEMSSLQGCIRSLCKLELLLNLPCFLVFTRVETSSQDKPCTAISNCCNLIVVIRCMHRFACSNRLQTACNLDNEHVGIGFCTLK